VVVIRLQREGRFGDPGPTMTAADGADRAPARPVALRRVLPALLLVVAVVAAVSIPHLPRGVCFGDAGDLQLASATLGIPHPPGYAGYVTLGYLATRIPGLSPAFAVSVLCMAAGIVVLVLCVLTQVRIGLAPWAAGAIALLLTSHPRFWQNLTTPEVYMPSLVFLTGAAYLLIRYAQTGGRKSLFAAAFVFGVALANRPPVLLTLPFFVAGWWLAARRWEPSRRHAWKSFLRVLAFAVLPGLYSLGYLWVRDTPQTPYSYIEQHNAEAGELPQSGEGTVAKLQRIVWQVSARQFHYRLGIDRPALRAKLRWLRYELVAHDTMPFAVTALLGLLGIVRTFRRCATTGILLCGMGLQSVVFVCMFRDVGQAADILPLLFPLIVFGGAALSTLFPIDGAWGRQLVAAGLMLVVTVTSVLDVPHRPNYGSSVDATGFLRDADLATFPEHSVILSRWPESLPLLYARHVLKVRDDLDVVIAQPGNWLRFAEGFRGRPVFLAGADGYFKDRVVTPFRNLWRLQE
jgi:hypothetical protein